MVVVVNLVDVDVRIAASRLSYLAEERWGATSLAAVAGVWSVVVALAAAIVTLVAVNFRRLLTLRESLGAGANASVLPVT